MMKAITIKLVAFLCNNAVKKLQTMQITLNIGQIFAAILDFDTFMEQYANIN